MRIPFPERISLLYVFWFAVLLCAAQVLEGTSSLFSLCSFLFIIIAALAFNLAGGFTRPSGSYVFFYAVLGVIIGLIWKAILGEPAESNLSVPFVTIEAYLGSICAILAAVYISRKLTLKRALLGSLLKDADMQNATIGCMITGMVLMFLNMVLPHEDGSILSALQQIDRFLPMAIILGVTHQIRKSGGTSSVNLPVLISFAAIFLSGVLGFSKEGMLTPFLCWLVAASAQRYRVSLYQVIGGIAMAVFIFQFLVPYAQYGRAYRSTSISENISNSISLLSNLGYVREQFLQGEEASHEEHALGYYNTPQGFFDRLQAISMDDALINVTEQGHVFGLSPIWASFANLVPHFIWTDKPRLSYGTMYAQEIGGLIPEDDTTTGISFTPTAEAFHLARWTGVLIVAPVLWILLFTVIDSLCGDVRRSLWGLLAIPMFAHAAPEGGIVTIGLMVYGTLSIVFAAVATAFVMPILGTLIAGPGKIAMHRTGRPLAPISSRIRPQPSPPA